MKRSAIYIRDPFILTHDGQYFMYSSIQGSGGPGFQAYRSRDLGNWEPPVPVFLPPSGFWSDRDYWAPEVHRYGDAFYLFASFKSENRCRGTQILRAESPLGPFVPISSGPVTPEDRECLDGTLFVDRGGEPWIVFCHEWVQIKDGTVCAMRLTRDLSAPAGEPVLLFRGSDAPWIKPFDGNYVTDGPFIVRTASGTLLMLWSSTCANGYCLACARSAGGRITGPWTQDPEPLFTDDGGHGMIFRTAGGEPVAALHAPNDFRGNERALLFRAVLTDSSLSLGEKIPE